RSHPTSPPPSPPSVGIYIHVVLLQFLSLISHIVTSQPDTDSNLSGSDISLFFSGIISWLRHTLFVSGVISSSILLPSKSKLTYTLFSPNLFS
ncbi:hypothetical protein HID58_045921, partial [Brassica napus]